MQKLMYVEWYVCLHHTLMVLNMLKPLRAVVTVTPGNWGCQCSSFTSCCPRWMNNSWGGIFSRSGLTSSSATVSDPSFSTAKSHWTTCTHITWIQCMCSCMQPYSLAYLLYQVTAYLVISSSWGKHSVVVPCPLYTGDGSRVVLEHGSGFTSATKGGRQEE